MLTVTLGRCCYSRSNRVQSGKCIRYLCVCLYVCFNSQSNDYTDSHGRYLFGQALGGIFISPISESFGRKPLYIASTLLYSVFSAFAAGIPHVSGVLVGRFICGVVSSVPSMVVAGSIEDMFSPEARVWIVFAWGATANASLTLGPIFSTFVTENHGW